MNSELIIVKFLPVIPFDHGSRVNTEIAPPPEPFSELSGLAKATELTKEQLSIKALSHGFSLYSIDPA